MKFHKCTLFYKEVVQIKNTIEAADHSLPTNAANNARGGGLWPDYCHTMLICVDSFQNRLAAGRLYTYCYSYARIFHSLDQMLFQVESILDETGLAQRWNRPRTLLESDQEETSKAAFPDRHMPALKPQHLQTIRGKLATFQLRVYARQNASMQGILEFVEGGRASFRSALELTRMILEVVEAKGDG
ncbi:hypothetical protein [uncultured Dysosmobacter sp.]|uniref:hypothetical protein n=1 Tax=uncultured Dysosmobacter sp. TaxID=2591384 RepID=UPI00263412A2|nr:hypothetical protein [uncultured Dysosmobacter sp.]